MKYKKILPWVQTALCVLFAVLLAAAALDIYRDGSARRAADPGASIYSVEAVAAHAKAPIAVLAVSTAVTVLCSALGVHGESGRADAQTTVPAAAATGRQRVSRVVLLVLAAVCIIAGICNGSMKDVLVKAINICTECIGLG